MFMAGLGLLSGNERGQGFEGLMQGMSYAKANKVENERRQREKRMREQLSGLFGQTAIPPELQATRAVNPNYMAPLDVQTFEPEPVDMNRVAQTLINGGEYEAGLNILARQDLAAQRAEEAELSHERAKELIGERARVAQEQGSAGAGNVANTFADENGLMWTVRRDGTPVPLLDGQGNQIKKYASVGTADTGAGTGFYDRATGQWLGAPISPEQYAENVGNVAGVRAEAVETGKNKAKLKESFGALNNLKSLVDETIKAPNFGEGVGPFDARAAGVFGLLPTDDYVVAKKVQRIASSLTLENAQKLSGALSDNDIKFLRETMPQPTDHAEVWLDWYNSQFLPTYQTGLRRFEAGTVAGEDFSVPPGGVNDDIPFRILD